MFLLNRHPDYGKPLDPADAGRSPRLIEEGSMPR
jgi:hypothetical protein